MHFRSWRGIHKYERFVIDVYKTQIRQHFGVEQQKMRKHPIAVYVACGDQSNTSDELINRAYIFAFVIVTLTSKNNLKADPLRAIRKRNSSNYYQLSLFPPLQQ